MSYLGMIFLTVHDTISRGSSNGICGDGHKDHAAVWYIQKGTIFNSGWYELTFKTELYLILDSLFIYAGSPHRLIVEFIMS